jgi:hypothetical protein
MTLTGVKNDHKKKVFKRIQARRHQPGPGATGSRNIIMRKNRLFEATAG